MSHHEKKVERGSETKEVDWNKARSAMEKLKRKDGATALVISDLNLDLQIEKLKLMQGMEMRRGTPTKSGRIR